MLLRNVLVLLLVVGLTACQNSTDDLEVRVTLLEDDVADLQDELEEVENVNTLQDQRFDNVEDDVSENTNDIDDMENSVNDAEEVILILQQQIAALEITNNLLLERVGVLETELGNLSNSTSQELAQLTTALNATDEIVQDTNVRLNTVEDDVANLLESDSEQNNRMTVIENDVDQWDDRIVSLEAANSDVQERLAVLEDTITVPWVACASSPCTNGGTCRDVNVDTFICMCRDGYYGETCQNTPTQACSSSPCKNGASCADINVDTFLCMCRDGYFGVTCSDTYADTLFLATFDYDPNSPADPIVFNYALINPGGHYDTTTGIYTVPLNGTYEFMTHLFASNDNNSAYGIYIEVDNDRVVYGDAEEGTFSDPTADLSVILSLTAGQQIWVSPNDISGLQGADGNGMYSWFSGHLIHAD